MISSVIFIRLNKIPSFRIGRYATQYDNNFVNVPQQKSVLANFDYENLKVCGI